LKEEDPVFRAVVFSQFIGFMDLIQTVLRREDYDHYRFDGTMDVKKKSSVISAFKAPSNEPKILIISLKAGGVGLNVKSNLLSTYNFLTIALTADNCKSCIHGVALLFLKNPLVMI